MGAESRSWSNDGGGMGIEKVGEPLNQAAPRDAAPLPSVGSANHPDMCHPCKFFPLGNCLLEENCSHCHYPHQARGRPGKKQRDRENARKEKAALTASGNQEAL